ncbi:HD domain-containing phosphohydrolase [Aliamphritea spongicola]|uniref:HD domain-containing phosphohydrolase n=1 Tax=Aliamphritea spongicola TaxID=707589 RepID=UPI00196AAE74|nr:HD domain-containing phosphohydrolase [Aliamphritea spongicola]MBN3560868.1 response regulator [Aliamphritea spongicola]
MEFPERSLLLVDDETSVLNALKRVLRRMKCTVHTAESGKAGLAVLEEHPVDLVISDMRMPEMGGEEFLAIVAERWPDTERIVMSGYSDTQATIDAINKGKISRFMTKPWKDDEVLSVVAKGFELTELRQRADKLEAVKEQKTRELAQLNKTLEQKVEQRTQQLRDSHQSLQNSYRAVVRMFSSITARRMGQDSRYNQNLNKLLLLMADRLNITGADLKQLFYAWQLRNIGKLSFDDELLKPAYVDLNAEQQRRFQRHPVLANASMVLVKPLHAAGQIVLQHKEYLDGSGYPSGLTAEHISRGAQVLAVLNDFVELINGRYQPRPYSSEEALQFLREFEGLRYDPHLIETLAGAVATLAKEGDAIQDERILSHGMKPGMSLTRDLLSEQGVLLLSAGAKLDQDTINRLTEMEENLGEQLEIYVDAS